MARKPTPGSDDGTWGDILNDFLDVTHNPDGTPKDVGVIAAKADDNSVIHNAGNETIAGSKTFSTSPIVPTTPTTSTGAVNKTYVDTAAAAGTPDATTTTKGKLQLAGDLGGTAAAPTVPGLATKADNTALATKADDTLVVHKASVETITGVKTFSAAPIVPTPTAPTEAASKGYVDGVPQLVRPQGGAPDGVTDDSARINTALLTAASMGGIVDLGGMTYTVAAGLTIPANSGIGNGTLLQTGWSQALITSSGSLSSAAFMTTDIARQTNLLNAPTSGLAVGDYLQIGSTASNNAVRPEWRKGEIVRVRQIVDATSFYIWGQTRDSYLVSDGAFVKKMNFLRGIRLIDLTLRNTDPGNHPGIGLIHFDTLLRPEVHNVNTIGADYNALRIQRCYGTAVSNFSATDERDDATNGFYGYGIAVAGSENTTITGGRFSRLRHAVTTDGIANQSGRTRGLVVTGAVALDTTLQAFDTHEDSEGTTYANCQAINCLGGGFQLRGSGDRINGGGASYCANGVEIRATATGAQVTGASFSFLGGLHTSNSVTLPATGAEGHGVNVFGATDVSVVNNVFTALLRPAVKYGSGFAARRGTIKGNTVRYVSNIGAVYIQNGVTQVTSMVIEGNHYAAHGTALDDTLLRGSPSLSFLNLDAFSSAVTGITLVNNTAIGMTGAWVSGQSSAIDALVQSGNWKLEQGSDSALGSFVNRASHHQDINAEDALHRDLATSSSAVTGDAIHVTCFTPERDLTISSIEFASGGTAQIGATLIRFGLFTMNGTIATLVARSASDTSLFTTTFTAYGKALDNTGGYPSTYKLLVGQRYAYGVIVVGATTQPTLVAMPVQESVAFRRTPICGRRTGQSDLASGTIVSSVQKFWASGVV